MLAQAACAHTDGKNHDCAYVAWRESLVPLAEEVADRLCPKPNGLESLKSELALERDPTGSAWAAKWNASFHRAMDRLTQDPFQLARLERMENYS